MSSKWTGGPQAAEVGDGVVDATARDCARAAPRHVQTQEDRRRLEDFEKRADPNDKEQMSLLEEMKAHTEKLEKMREFEDPRLSFTTPEFKEAQRIFQENYKKNFGRPVEYGMVKKYPWSTPTLMKLDVPVDVDGNPWPLDAEGNPILKDEPEEDEFA
ncbi:unnamed product [Ostreococcus tauri]|uniref:Unnamed product n=1 Tax=Ostreococcus tauri TaxID=70448 RepID=A0A090N3V7_OSTTA|nr:unnamed product [Ostreococcus tauri]CEF98788.1 unnamed product [Ostreococcus tauri]|eukprot:XP_022839466.1 unnamed product [Ostreococcus tauri]